MSESTLKSRYVPSKSKAFRSPAMNRWFAENTFHSDEFADLESLVSLKKENNLTISLGLPTLNEERTVGHIIRNVKRTMMEEVPLLDEMILIDSGSADRTREIAADLGIPVFVHQDTLAHYGSYHGKGDALWKSLYLLTGDLIAWIDTDISNFHPRFVYGILGPLLHDRRIQYVKGFYRRPIKQDRLLIGDRGGRVTELTVRPLFNMFFPELSGVIQPLSGEYAGRRWALERLPFFSGYGVETGLLIDSLKTFGLEAIAQVDLIERIHSHQPLSALSKMSFAIIQLIINRLEQQNKIVLPENVSNALNLIRLGSGGPCFESLEIREWERPPIIALAEYQKRRSLGSGPSVECGSKMA